MCKITIINRIDNWEHVFVHDQKGLPWENNENKNECDVGQCNEYCQKIILVNHNLFHRTSTESDCLVIGIW